MDKTLDKAVILARGLGTRMQRPDPRAALDPRQDDVAQTGIKAMIPVGRPLVDHVLSVVAEAGLREVCLVIGPEQDALRKHVDGLRPERLSIALAVQQEPRGTADAVAAAEGFAGRDDFVVINCDNYYPLESLTWLRGQSGPAVALFDSESLVAGSNISRQRLLRFAVGEISGDGFLKRIVEKPDAAMLASLRPPIAVSMNCWRFGPAIFEACRSISPSVRGELELTDAVQRAIDVLGIRFRAGVIHAPVFDLTSRGDIAAVTAVLAGREVRL